MLKKKKKTVEFGFFKRINVRGGGVVSFFLEPNLSVTRIVPDSVPSQKTTDAVANPTTNLILDTRYACTCIFFYVKNCAFNFIVIVTNL